MRSRHIPVLAAIAAVGVPTLFAAPASAGSTPPAACGSSTSCMVELNWAITYTGSTGGNNGVAFTPPPCIGVPWGDAHTGSQIIISLYSNTAPVSSGSASPSPSYSSASPAASATTSFPPPADNLPPVQRQILSQAEQLVKTNPIVPGEWYQIDPNSSASAAAQQACNKLPPYAWVPGGGRLQVHGLPIPEELLAQLVYNQLTTATLGAVTLNPEKTSDTNLPTFVDVVLNHPRLGELSITTAGIPYVSATATAPNGQAATVWATVTGLTIHPGTTNATTYQDPRCVTAHLSTDGREFILGSRDNPSAMEHTGANQPIDCGVTYTAPGTYNLTVSIGWKACWAPGLPTAAGPPPGKLCRPVPGAVGGLQDSVSAPITINVREIQSVNG